MLTAFYDLASSPPTYDFVSFLVSAERRRIELGAAEIAFVIVPGPDHGFRLDHLPPRDPQVRRAMLRHIVAAMCDLLPSAAGCTVCDSRDQAGEIRGRCRETDVFPVGWMPGNRASHYGTVHMVTAYRAGIFPLRAPCALAVPTRTVTITLREAQYWPSRNSNRAAWLTVAERLRDAGRHPLFVPDSDSRALDEIVARGFAIDSAASSDLHRRAALYTAAEHNLFVSNGPAWVATFMPAVHMTVFKMLAPDAPCTTTAFFAQAGFPEGAQVGRAGHRIVWADDDADTILETLQPRTAA